jgi:hypothetical protein
MTDLGIEFYDIAFRDNLIWYAVEDPAEPIQVYNSVGTMVFSIASSIVPGACGMTFDDEGYLWVSDDDTDLIYKVDLDETGISGQEGGSSAEASLALSMNPFHSSVDIQLTGFAGSVSTRILDMSGRTVAEFTSADQLTWNGEDRSGSQVPAGSYLVISSDQSGTTASARLIRL